MNSLKQNLFDGKKARTHTQTDNQPTNQPTYLFTCLKTHEQKRNCFDSKEEEKKIKIKNYTRSELLSWNAIILHWADLFLFDHEY